MTIANLPTQNTAFIGREAELAEILNLLSRPDCRMLTLTGPGGIGKTSLALYAAAGTSFPQGAHFVALQPLTSPDAIVSTLASTLKYMFYGDHDTKTQLLGYLREKQLLLVLDNFEHLLGGATLLPEILGAAPGVKLLVTSRERLNLHEEWVLDIHGLSFPDGDQNQPVKDYAAVELFTQSARRAGYTPQAKDNEAIARICRLLEGIPLAIELASGWVRALSCEQIASEIEHNLDILSTSMRNFPEKHRSMRAAFEYSWALLSEAEKTVFMKLSVFRGGFTREAAEQVADSSLATLAMLVDKSLLRREDTGRYSLQEMLRQFAGEQLRVSGELEETLDAHSAYYAAFLQQIWQPLRNREQAKAVREIDAEYENIRVAWHWLVKKQRVAELNTAVYPLWWYSELRSRYPEAQALFRHAEEELKSISGSAEANRLLGVMLSCRGAFYETFKRPDEGRPLAIRGLEILENAGDSKDLVLAYHNLTIMEAQVDDDAAYTAAITCARIAKSTGDPWWIALAHTNLWLESHYMYTYHHHVMDLETIRLIAQAYYEYAEACGDTWLRAYALVAQKMFFLREGNYAEALQYGEQALALRLECGQSIWIADAYNHLAIVHCVMGNYPESARNLYQSLKILPDQEDSLNSLTIILRYTAGLWSRSGQQESAVKIYAFLKHELTSLERERSDAEEALQELSNVVPAQAFVAAQQRGKSLTLKALVQEVMDELEGMTKTKQAPPVSGGSTANELLTSREIEILRLVAEGFTNPEVSERLYLSTETIKWYLREIYSKLEVHNRAEAVDRARELGLI